MEEGGHSKRRRAGKGFHCALYTNLATKTEIKLKPFSYVAACFQMVAVDFSANEIEAKWFLLICYNVNFFVKKVIR